MKRILTILLVVMMVFSMTGCDPESRANLADMMGAMGHNVMGSDTSSVGDVVANTEVKADDIVKKPEVGGAEVKVSENISMKATQEDGKVVTTVTVAGKDFKVEEEIKAVLPPMKAKDETIKNIGSALKNDASKDKLIQDMKKPVESAEVKEAAQGTAIVMKSALAQVAETLPTDKVPEAVKESLKNVSDSLASIAEKPDTVSQADVVTLQLVNDFVETISKNADAIEKGEVPEEVLTDANNLFTVSSALSEASKFNPNTLVGAVVSGIPKGKTIESRAPRAIEDKLDRPVPAEVQNYIHIAYEAIVDVLGEDDFAQTKSGLGFHKMSYENYANMVAGKVDLKFVDRDDEKQTIRADYDKTSEYLSSREFTEFKSFTGLTQYVVATAFSEGDDLYLALKDLFGRKEGVEYTMKVEKDGTVSYETKTLTKMDTSGFDANVRDLILSFAEVNPWIKNPTDKDVNLEIPEKYKDLLQFPDMDAFAEVFMRFMTGRKLNGTTEADYNKVIEGEKQYFKAAFETVNRMLVFTDLGELADVVGDVNLNYGFTTMISDLYTDQNPEANK